MTFTSQELYDHWSTKRPHSYEIAFDPLSRKWPYGQDLPEYLGSICEDESVIDFGCGTGRFAPSFDPSLYVGVDINKSALALARKTNPNHNFYNASLTLVPTQTVLAIEVLLHVHDEDISEMIGRLASMSTERVLVLEIMDPKYRDLSVHSGNRSIEEYRRLAAQHGMSQKVLDIFSVTNTTDVYGTLVEWRHQ